MTPHPALPADARPGVEARRPAYGLDIETDTATGGLDPGTSRVTAIGVAGRGWTRTFDGDEARLLADADRFLATLEPGLLVTWNGTAFDLPFVSTRAAVAGVDLRLESPPPGQRFPATGEHRRAPDRGRWCGHDHVDAYLELAPLARRVAGTGRLKAFAACHGIPCLEPDPTRLHVLAPEALRRYVASDARATLALADHYGLTGTLVGPVHLARAG